MSTLSQTVMHHAAHPHRMGPLADANRMGQEGAPGEGPYMKIMLRMEGEQIVKAGFDTYGCPSCIACGSWITQWVEGRTREAVSIIESNDLRIVLGGLPLGKEHCAQLAVNALKCALSE